MSEEWIVTIISVVIICTAAAISIVIILSDGGRRDRQPIWNRRQWYLELWNIQYGYKVCLNFENSITLGRYNLHPGPYSNQAIPEDNTVSREHVLIYDQNGALWIWNLSTVNPAKINGFRLNEPQYVQQGKRLELGNSVFLITDVQYR